MTASRYNSTALLDCSPHLVLHSLGWLLTEVRQRRDEDEVEGWCGQEEEMPVF
jgi:hypothetical protein